MATYEITSPEGRTYEIEGPEGASREQVLQVLQQHIANRPTPTGGGSLLHGAERGIAPGAAGLAAFGPGAEAGAAAGTAIFPGIGTAIGSVLGGVGAAGLAAWGASAAQQRVLKAMPKTAAFLGQDTETQEEEQAAHPYLSQIGEAAPQFAAFRPSAAMFKSLKGLTGKAAEEVVNARKMALANTVIGAGQEAGGQMVSDQPMDWTRVGVAGALGAAASKETALGRRVAGAFMPGHTGTPTPAAAENPAAPPSPTGAAPEGVVPAAAEPVTPARKSRKAKVVEPESTAPPASSISTEDLAAGPQEIPTPVSVPDVAATPAQDVSPPEKTATPGPILPNETSSTEPVKLPGETPVQEPVPVAAETSPIPSRPVEPAVSLKDGILAHLKSNPDATNKSMAAVFGEMPSKISATIRNELSDSIVSNEKVGRQHRWLLKDQGTNPPPPIDQAGVGEPAADGSAGRMEVPVGSAAPEGAPVEGSVPGGVGDHPADVDPGHVGTQGEQPAVDPRAWYREPLGDEIAERALREYQAKPKQQEPLPDIAALRKQALEERQREQLAKIQQEEIARKKAIKDAADAKAEADRQAAADAEAKQKEISDAIERNKARVQIRTKGKKVIVPDQDMSLTPEERAAARERVAAQRDQEENPGKPAWQPEVIPKRAAIHEGEVARRNAEPEPPKLSVDTVQDIIDEHTKDWVNKPDIFVHRSVDDLPSHIPNVPDDTRGLSYGKEVHLIADNIRSPERVRAVLFHESLGHYGLKQKFDDARVNVMGDIYNTNPTMKKAADTWLATYGTDGHLKNLSPERQKAYATEEILAKASEQGPIENSGALERATAWIRNFARKAGLKVNYTENDVRQILREAHERVTGGTKRAVADEVPQLSRATKQAPPRVDRSYDEIVDNLHENKKKDGTPIYNRYNKPGTVEQIKTVLSKPGAVGRGWNESVRLLQNQQDPLLLREQQMAQSGSLIRDESKGLNNDVATKLAMAPGKATDYAEEYQGYLHKARSIQTDYMKATGLDADKTIRTMEARRLARDEPKTRAWKFDAEKPLDNTNKNKKVGGVMMTDADYRDAIMKELHSSKNLSNGTAAKLRAQLSKLQPVKGGFSPDGKVRGIDINGHEYNTHGDYTRAEIQALQDADKNDPHKDLVDKYLDNWSDIINHSKDLNEKANYWTQPVKNLVEAMGRDYYMPMKGGKEDEKFDPFSKFLSGEHNQFAEKAEGRDSNAHSPFLQTMADAAAASRRAGGEGVTQAMINLIKADPSIGKFVKNVPFIDRYHGLTGEDVQTKNNFFHYKPDGSFDVYKIRDPKINEAFKGFTTRLPPWWEGINSITRAIGAGHTRYNPGFAPFNYVRHGMTAAWMNGAEQDSMMKAMGGTAKYLGRVAAQIVNGGIPRAWNAWKLMGSDPAKLAELAKINPSYRNMHEYISNGGKIEFKNSLGFEGTEKFLIKDVGRGGFLRTIDHINHLFDLYNGAFELAGRAAGYGVLKEQITAREAAAGRNVKDPGIQAAINKEAAATSLGYFNYRQVGKYGREAGSLYMFLRPSLTTAVRATRAIAPAFRDIESAVSALPESIRNDPQQIDKFRQTYVGRQQAARATVAAMFGSGIALYSIAKSMAPLDSQGRNKIEYDDMSRWQRVIRFPVGDSFVQLPWGFGLGAFGSAGAQIGGWLNGQSSLGEALKNMVEPAMDSFMPLPVAKFDPSDHPIAFAITSAAPSFARPFLEYAMNVDEFGKKIYNDRNSAFGDAYTGGDHLPPLYGDATKLLADHTDGAINISPDTLHFFAANYLDGIARISHDTYGMALTGMGKKEFDPKRDIPLVDSFIGKSSDYDAREFAKVAHDINGIKQKLTMFKENPDQLERYNNHNPNARLQVQMFDAQNRMLSEVRKQLKLIQQNPELSLKEKSEMSKDLTEQRDYVMHSIVESSKDWN